MTSCERVQGVMTPNIQKALAYVKDKMYAELPPEQAAYRYPHTLRVADIGAQIGMEAGLDTEALVLACLLHDIGYVRCRTQADYEDHGKLSADMAEEFLETLPISPERRESICYGIRIHTLETEKHPRPATPLEWSVVDADNIDSFGANRIYDLLARSEPEKMPPQALRDLAASRAEQMARFRAWRFATEAGQRLWEDHTAFHEEFYRRLQSRAAAFECPSR